ncbi:ankyrin repeat domain-containing protein, partial [Endozoicomonas sp. SESOKO3]
MDAMTRSLPMITDVKSQAALCPICRDDFHGHNVAPVDVKPQYQTRCGHHFHLDCISKHFVKQSIGSRQCKECGQNPTPVLNESTGVSHPDKFFPDHRFYDACFDGNLKKVKKSLAEGVNVNAVMKDDLTALMIASIKGHTDVAEHLIKNRAEVNAARACDGFTPLMLAAEYGNTECVQLLLDKGADLDARNKGGATPLLCGLPSGNTNCVKLMID